MLPSIDDPLDFASRLVAAMPGCQPLLAVGDEDQAFRNYANDDPSLHIACVLAPDQFLHFLRIGL